MREKEVDMGSPVAMRRKVHLNIQQFFEQVLLYSSTTGRLLVG